MMAGTANNSMSDSPIISYADLVSKEQENLQKGMNFRTNKISVFLMSTRKNAPYKDRWDQEKNILIYEGHDAPGKSELEKKTTDQPMKTSTGRLTENGKFHQAAKAYASKRTDSPLPVQIYEKIQNGIWFDKGIFNLIDCKIENDGTRNVFKYYLTPSSDLAPEYNQDEDYKHERLIPSWVKVEVYKRDQGKCTSCGAANGLHYDHILPFSKGGRSDDPKNIQILCARHNLQKSNKIQ